MPKKPDGELNPWLIFGRIHPNPIANLFVFPHAGGSSSQYRFWQDLLPKQIQVIYSQLPGRDTRIGEDPPSDLSQVVDLLVEAMTPHIYNLPYFILGHSLGSLIGFEVCHELTRRKLPLPRALFVSGSRGPQLPDEDEPIHHLPKNEFLKGLSKYEDTPPEFMQSEELIELFLPVIKADFKMSETYTYKQKPTLPLPIFAFGGLDDKTVTREELQGWQAQTQRPLRVQMFQGNHFYCLQNAQPFIEALSKDISILIGSV